MSLLPSTTTISNDFYFPPLPAEESTEAVTEVVQTPKVSHLRPRNAAIAQVSDYDQYFAFLAGGIVILSVIVIILYAIWLSLFESEARTNQKLITFSGIDLGQDLTSEFDNNLAKPGFAEFPEIEQPAMSKELIATTEAASVVAATPQKTLGEDSEIGGAYGGGKDVRQRGTPQDQPATLPAHQRWRLEYTAESKKQYFQILDHFEIYLGAVAKQNNEISFFEKLSNSQPVVEKGNRESDKAQVLYFFNPRRTAFRRWEAALVHGHDQALRDRIIVHFIPETVQNTLLELESQQLDSDQKSLEDVKSIVFGCRAGDERSFEYYVKQTTYR